MWNDDPSLAGSLATEDVHVWFGGADSPDLAGRGELTGFVERYRAARPGLTYATHRVPLIDTERQLAALTWTVAEDDRVRGGIDLLQFTAGTLNRVWSVTADKDFSF